MVQIKIKGLTDGIHVIAAFDDEQTFLYEVNERLKQLSRRGELIEAFFHLPQCSDHTLLTLFQLCDTHHILIKGFDELTEIASTLCTREGTLHNGQHIVLSKDTLWIGDLHRGSYITTSANLYVIGSIEGIVDLYHEHLVLVTSHIDGSVRICDSIFHNLTSFSPIKVYYNKRTIEIEHVKEELYGRGHCDYVR